MRLALRSLSGHCVHLELPSNCSGGELLEALHEAIEKPGVRAVVLWQGRVVGLEERLEDLLVHTELNELDYALEPANLRLGGRQGRDPYHFF